MTEDAPVNDPGPGAQNLGQADQTVEVRIAEEVYDLARERARSQGQALVSVARTILFQEAGKTPVGAEVADGRPPLRTYGEKRKRLRFDAPLESYIAARDSILTSGRSISQAVEAGLARYAETGRL